MTNISCDASISIVVDTDDYPGGKSVKFEDLPEDVLEEILDDIQNNSFGGLISTNEAI